MMLLRTPRAYRDAGFSLPEILVVVVIIGVLAAIAIPRLSDQEDRAAAASARADARQLAILLETGLPELLNLEGPAEITYNAASARISIFEENQPAGSAPTVPAKLSPGSILVAPSSGSGNNILQPDGTYCLAVQNRDFVAYYTRSGFVVDCTEGAATIGVPGAYSGGGDNSAGPVIPPGEQDKSFFPEKTDPAVSWNSVTYGSSLFVAVSSTSAYGTSADGVDWNTSRTLPAAASSIAFGSGKFIAATAGGFYYSSDPASGDGNWTAITGTVPSSASWRIAYGGGIFVAVTPEGGGKWASSADGISWTAGNAPTELRRIAFAGGLFFALAGTAGAPSIAYTSANGESWDSVGNIPDPGTGFWRDVSAVNGVFYLVGSDITLANVARGAVSGGSITWSRPTMPTGVSVWSFAVGGAGKMYLFPVSGDNAAKSSDGGVTFTNHGLSPPDAPAVPGDIAWSTGGLGLDASAVNKIVIMGNDGWFASGL